MSVEDIQSFVNGFVAALQLFAPDTRIVAIRRQTLISEEVC